MKRLLSALLLLATLSVAAQNNYSYGIDTKRDDEAFAAFRKEMAWKYRTRPTIALVLSGGGAKGAAHISIIKALEREGIPVDMVVGTSIGGLVGGLYACGYTGDELEKIIRAMDWDYLMGDTHERKFDSAARKEYDDQFLFSLPFGKSNRDFSGKTVQEEAVRSFLPDGIVQGQNVRNLLSSLTVGFGQEMDFFKLPIPFVCVAADVVTAQPKVWHSGLLVDAMRSTMSIPGLFTPLRKDGMVLMDGGMRSNFPADIAKKMGANIIIGVDISTPGYTADQINNLVDIVYQIMDVLGRESYEAGVKATTVYIKPDLLDFTMLDFDEKSIDTIIGRGRAAADGAKKDLREVKKRLHGAEPKPLEKRAVNFIETPISVSNIDFTGVSVRDRIYLRRQLGLGRLVTKQELDAAVAELLGSSAFQMVTYDIVGTQAPYQIIFNCKMAPVNRLAASARFDTYEYASILLSAGFNASRLTGSRFDLTARLGLKSHLKADYALRTQSGLDLCVSGLAQHVSKGEWAMPPYDFQIDYSRAKADAFLRMSKFKFMTAKAGAAVDWYKYNRFLMDYTVDSGITPPAASNAYMLAYAQVNWDTFDNSYFPTTGIKWDIRGEYIFKGLVDDIPQFFTVKGSFKAAVPARVITLIPSVDFRYVSGTSMPFFNFLSVAIPGRILDGQIPFVGLNTASTVGPLFTSAGLEARVNFATKHHISLLAQVGRTSTDFGQYFSSENTSLLYGVALQYALQTIAGPVKFDLHWSNINKAFGAYLSLGLDF